MQSPVLAGEEWISRWQCWGFFHSKLFYLTHSGPVRPPGRETISNPARCACWELLSGQNVNPSDRQMAAEGCVERALSYSQKRLGGVGVVVSSGQRRVPSWSQQGILESLRLNSVLSPMVISVLVHLGNRQQVSRCLNQEWEVKGELENRQSQLFSRWKKAEQPKVRKDRNRVVDRDWGWILKSLLLFLLRSLKIQNFWGTLQKVGKESCVLSWK